MGETPTKPGWWVWSETPDGPRGVVNVYELFGGLVFEAAREWRIRRIDQGYFHHEVSLDEPASPWRLSAEESPAVPEGADAVEVFAMHDMEDESPMPQVEMFTVKDGWLTGDPPDAWMYIPEYNRKMLVPPRGEGRAE